MSLIRDLPNDERPREKLAHLGPSALSNAELLALFLRTGIKGKSAVQVGQDLLRHFGSINSLGSAGLRSLQSAPGLGLAKAAQLVAAFELGARAAREHVRHAPLDAPERIHSLFGPQLAWLGQEKLIVALVNARLDHIATEEISTGTLTETSAHPREILRAVILRNAFGFVLIHNHPSGDPTPSDADCRFTKRLNDAADLLKVRFIDHVIIGRPGEGREGYFSFREAGLVG